MSWLPWRRPSPAPQVTPPTPPTVEEEPEPPQRSLLEKIAHWRAVFAAERQAQPTIEQVERAREHRRRALAEQEEDRLAQLLARNGGVVFPGDTVDLPGADGMPRLFGTASWAAQADLMDWRARVSEAQRQDIDAGARGPEP